MLRRLSLGVQRGAVVPFHGLDGFRLDERHLTVRTRIVGVAANLIAVAVPFESPADDRPDFLKVLHAALGILRDLYRDYRSFGHDCSFVGLNLRYVCVAWDNTDGAAGETGVVVATTLLKIREGGSGSR